MRRQTLRHGPFPRQNMSQAKVNASECFVRWIAHARVRTLPTLLPVMRGLDGEQIRPTISLVAH